MVPHNCQTESTDHSQTIAVEDLYKWLEWVQNRLCLNTAYLPKDDQYTGIGMTEIKQLVLPFFDLQRVADTLSDSDSAVPVQAYQELNRFLSEVNFEWHNDLEERWKKTIGIRNQRKPMAGEGSALPDVCAFVTEATSDAVISKGLKSCGMKAFPEGNIQSVLGMILLWFDALPCAAGAERERNRYSRRLRDRLDLLVDPTHSEFRGLTQEALRKIMLVEIVKHGRPEYLQHGKGYNASCENEHALDMDKPFGI